MKKILIATCICCCLSAAGFAQTLSLQARLEKSVKGSGFETGLTYEFKNRFGIGAFGQTKGMGSGEGESGWKDPFYGMMLQIPMIRDSRVFVSGVLRAGLINRDFFVVVPAIETNLKLFKNTSAIIGAGYRHGYPSASVALKQTIKSFK